MIFKKSKQNGYTLLFAVLTAVLVLGVGIFILGVSRKQYILSSTAKDSFIALNAADSGIECLVQAKLYNFSDINTITPADLKCNNVTPVTYESSTAETSPINVQVTAKIPPADNDYYLYFPHANQKECVIVKIFRGTDNNNGNTVTVVNARGYNVCETPDKGPSKSLRTVERAMQFKVQ